MKIEELLARNTDAPVTEIKEGRCYLIVYDPKYVETFEVKRLCEEISKTTHRNTFMIRSYNPSDVRIFDIDPKLEAKTCDDVWHKDKPNNPIQCPTCSSPTWEIK